MDTWCKAESKIRRGKEMVILSHKAMAKISYLS